MSFKVYGPGVVQMPPLPPREHVRNAFEEQLRRWDRPVPSSNDGKPTGEQKVRDAIKLLDTAIKRLGRRDRDSIRQRLHDQRDSLKSALAAFEAIGANLDGVLAIELVARLTQARAARDRAESEFEAAGRNDVAARRADLDATEADLRAVGREIAAALEAMTFPRLPNAEHFKSAEASTAHLSHWIPRSRPAATLQEALRQGAEASPEEAKLWIIYEDGPHEFYEWRYRRFTERARDGEGSIVAPATPADAKPRNPKGLSPELFAGKVKSL